MHVAIPISKVWLPMSLAAGACCLLLFPQPLPQRTSPLLNGFDTAKWDRERPEQFTPLIESKLSKLSRTDVATLLGPPDRSSPAGEGMFGPYQAYYSYILDCEKDKEGVRQNGYVWHELHLSFSPGNKVSKIEVRSHAY
ncbi:MAG: hypothetical protein JST89_06220 [Cyanobacteria bacterium SZAS-4]|nr:hypothetical protein [Cyanobacteria bacterium SZAS-4]